MDQQINQTLATEILSLEKTCEPESVIVMVIVRTSSGVRKTHIRQLKRIPQNLMDEIQKEKLDDF